MISRYPLFGCTSCYEDCSWPADDLREHEGELWCDSCWDGADMRETTDKDWGDLAPFVPEAERRIAELEAQLAEAIKERDQLKAARAGYAATLGCEVGDAHEKLREALAQLAEARELLVMPSDYWTAEEGEDFRKRRDALLKALAGEE